MTNASYHSHSHTLKSMYALPDDPFTHIPLPYPAHSTPLFATTDQQGISTSCRRSARLARKKSPLARSCQVGEAADPSIVRVTKSTSPPPKATHVKNAERQPCPANIRVDGSWTSSYVPKRSCPLSPSPSPTTSSSESSTLPHSAGVKRRKLRHQTVLDRPAIYRASSAKTRHYTPVVLGTSRGVRAVVRRHADSVPTHRWIQATHTLDLSQHSFIPHTSEHDVATTPLCDHEQNQHTIETGTLEHSPLDSTYPLITMDNSNKQAFSGSDLASDVCSDLDSHESLSSDEDSDDNHSIRLIADQARLPGHDIKTPNYVAQIVHQVSRYFLA